MINLSVYFSLLPKFYPWLPAKRMFLLLGNIQITIIGVLLLTWEIINNKESDKNKRYGKTLLREWQKKLSNLFSILSDKTLKLLLWTPKKTKLKHKHMHGQTNLASYLSSAATNNLGVIQKLAKKWVKQNNLYVYRYGDAHTWSICFTIFAPNSHWDPLELTIKTTKLCISSLLSILDTFPLPQECMYCVKPSVRICWLFIIKLNLIASLRATLPRKINLISCIYLLIVTW